MTNVNATGNVTAGDTVLNTNGLTIAGGPSVTKSGINAADKKISNVKAGDVSETSQDAVMVVSYTHWAILSIRKLMVWALI